MTSISLVLPVRRRWEWGLRRFTITLAARWHAARQRRETRRYIMGMDEHMLADIGVSRAQALFEIDRPR